MKVVDERLRQGERALLGQKNKLCLDYKEDILFLGLLVGSLGVREDVTRGMVREKQSMVFRECEFPVLLSLTFCFHINIISISHTQTRMRPHYPNGLLLLYKFRHR